MAIIKDVTVKINNGTATLDAPVQFYEKDHDVELRFRLMDYKYKYDKDPQNILNSVDEDILEAYTTIVNPRGYELEQINGVVKNDVVIFRLDPTYTDELDELGTYKLQIHIKCTHSEFTIPPITFEVLQRLKGIKVVTDGEDEVDNSEILDNSSKFVSDETGKLIIEWKKGDMISSAKLNAMVDVINDAVDEEKIRQENEIEREKKANNKIQELENTRVEYVNKFDDELDSFADQVDTTMSDYETRFNALTVSQQQDAEIIDARDGEQTLRARLDRDIQKPSIIYEEVEGSCINVNTTCGYAQNVEIIGNTIQNQNDLADIRSVGDKLENQELYEIPVLSCVNNLFNNKDYGIFKAANSTCTIVYNEITDIYEMTYSGAFSYAVLDLTKNLHVFEGKTLIASCKYSNSNSSAKFSIYLQGIDKEGKIHYFNSGSNSLAAIPKDTLTTLNLRVYANNSSDILSGVFTFTQIQIEEGTVATPYEPYQGDKLTILSPTPLEKVGDVADRIICKDGVWGVEKNISTTVFDGSEHWRYHSTKDNTSFFQLSISSSIYRLPKNDNTTANILSNRFLNTIPNIGYNNDIEGIYLDTRTNLSVRVLNTKLNTQDLAGFKSWLSENSILLKYQLAQPTFIPLPHDQQIKLRTFANKTNISFGCEIEPTLKASVPKSLGASVSSHSEQIDNLSKELEKINNLEESTVSTVTTESCYTTVTETSNGYFEDVKLEGRTLVNLNDIPKGFTVNAIGDICYIPNEGKYLYNIKPNTLYTFIVYGMNYKFNGTYRLPGIVKDTLLMTNGVGVFRSMSDIDYSNTRNPHIYGSKITVEDVSKLKLVILEGDHTQNPPEYFEGLKSVGQDVDEISVLSQWANGNLFNVNDVVSDYSDYYKCDEYIKYENGVQRTYLKQDFEPNTQYSFTFKASNSKASSILFSCRYTDGTHESFEIINSESNKIHTSSFTSSEGKSIKEVCSFYSDSGIITLYLDGTCINKGTTPILYTPYKEDKKRILYYNDETQKWEKPILREWDSIEKHSDGKYYYHKRSGEVVLNGSENWADYGPSSSNESSKCFYVSTPISRPLKGDYMCDRLSTGVYNADLNNVTDITKVTNSLYFNTDPKYSNYAYIRVELSKLSSQDVAGFKTWLQANQTTVVCQLETEKVYECTDLDLITYADETNLMFKGGAIVPKTTLKVHQNIANVTTILQEKVNVLENNVGHVTEVFSNINNDLTNLTESIEGSYVSVVSKDGYLKDIEILGNTVQDKDNLADIRSVGDKLENQELYEIPVLCTGKNLFDEVYANQSINGGTGAVSNAANRFAPMNFIRCKANTPYTIKITGDDVQIRELYYYNLDGTYIGVVYGSGYKTLFTFTPTQDVLVAWQCKRMDDTDIPVSSLPGVVTTQLEEGSVATEYESYQEDKLTILSPVQLEKVGDVADRIVCKDGVWGVEKNIGELSLNGSETLKLSSTQPTNTNLINVYARDLALPNGREVICDKFVFTEDNNVEGIFVGKTSSNLHVSINKDKLTTQDLAGVRVWLQENNVLVKHQLTQPQFIPLPHDQQIKLRTFANKTNIHFLTEIEPTLKASVPKSLSATVSTHTEQIDNLGKEIDKVKKLEESTVSTVATESDFTTVEQTSNGYFEDVKLEGRTLVNLCGDCVEKNNAGINLTDNIVTFSGTSGAHWIRYDTSLLKPNTTYTLIMLGIDVRSRIGCDLYPDNFPELGFVNTDRPINVYKFTTPDDLSTLVGIRYYVSNGVTESTKLYSPIILEGDHTQNQPSYFEGLKSVGQDVDEISVLSCNENLFDVKSVIEKYPSVLTPFGNGLSAINGVFNLTYLIPDVNKQYTISWHGELVTQSSSNAYIGFAFAYTDGTSDIIIGVGDKNISSTKGKTIKEFKITYSNTCTMNLTNISLVQGDTPKPYTPHKQDKKRILYYDQETQTWEKPVLREWDSIEKHADGKYYYHKRSGEVVLNGSEDWSRRTGVNDDGVHVIFAVNVSFKYNKSSYMICDRVKPMPATGLVPAYSNGECLAYYTTVGNSDYIIYYVLAKSKLSAQDVQGFKQWLQANPTTVVYQLAEEKVYECTNLDLITYENETNFIVNTGAISPKSTLKVMCNITNVVRELQQKVSNLENYIQHVMIDALNNALNE